MAERRRAVKTSESTERLRITSPSELTEQVLAAISSVLIVTDARGRVLRWNLAAERTFGLPAAAVFGKPLREVFAGVLPPDTVERICDVEAHTSGTRFDDVPYQSQDARTKLLGLTVSRLADHSGAAAGVIVMGADITGRRTLEAQLAQSQKLESIGQLAAGIAHEINTPTQYVADNLRFLSNGVLQIVEVLRWVTKLPSDRLDPEHELRRLIESMDAEFLIEEMPSAVEQALDGVERIAHIVAAMRKFSHPGSEEKTLTDINELVRNVSTVSRNEWRYTAELVLELADDLPLVPCFPADLGQVVLNLIVNAIHALQERQQEDPGRTNLITIRTQVVEGGVELRVEDNGTGVPLAVQSRVFDPFFTTKEVGRGTGQGLSISRTAIVKKLGGSLTYENTPGGGATFVIRLPV